MGHNPGTRTYKIEKKKAAALRTPEERLAAIRSSLDAHLFVTPDDQKFLLEKYDREYELLVQTTSLMQDATKSLQEAYAEIETLKALLKVSDESYPSAD